MRTFNKHLVHILAGAVIAIAGCAGNSTEDPNIDPCAGDTCDDPGSTADALCRQENPGDSAAQKECRDNKAAEHCLARQSDALDSANKGFTKDAIRWAAADVEGVNTNGRDDRGQEYTEYFAIVQPPPASEGAKPGPAEIVGRVGGSGQLSVELSEDQIFALEDEPDSVVGQCMFTAWHQDIREGLPVCNGSDDTCPELTYAENAKLPSWQEARTMGVKLTMDIFKMSISINSNGAAADLFEKCLSPAEAGNPSDPNDPLHQPFFRSCMKTYGLFKTEWRRSDPAVCTAGVRLVECGCGVDSDGDGVADITGVKEISRALVPHQPDADGTLRLRGFHLGTWSDKDSLPTGCRYIETGDTDSTKTLVACDLTASDLLASSNDPKGKCREKYGDNVVVHVPVPAAAVVCNPPEDGPYADTCAEHPWVITNETTTRDPDPDTGRGGTDTCNFDVCAQGQTGTPPASDCNTCTVAVCAADDWCCNNTWDSLCVGAVNNTCATDFACEVAPTGN